MKGNLEGKKAVLLQLVSVLEAKRQELHNADRALENDLFYIFNNLNKIDTCKFSHINIYWKI